MKCQMKTMSSFTHSNVISNPYELSLFAESKSQTAFPHTNKTSKHKAFLYLNNKKGCL